MINSIQHFIEKETYEIEKTMRKFVEGALDIDSYGKELQERSLNLARNILAEKNCFCRWAVSDLNVPAIHQKRRGNPYICWTR
ncbi:hypothetical protein QMP26_14165 [Enterocloster clostridioformis]